MKYTYEQPEYLDIDGARHLVQELKVYIQEILNGNIDITQYATKEELSNAVSSIDLTDYAKTSDIPSLDGYAKSTDIPSLDGYATKSYVDENIANVATSGEVDLTNYVTKDTVYTKEETNALIPSTEGLATETYVDNAVSNVPTTDLTGYATEEYVSTAINSIPATDLSNYYTKDETYNKTEVDTLVANSGGSSSGGDSGTEGGGETPTPTPTVTGTSAISGSTNLRCGVTRTYTGKFYNADESEATDVTGEWSITAPFAESKFTTKTITGNSIKLGYDDENLIDEEFTLTFSDPNGNYTPSSITITCVDVM